MAHHRSLEPARARARRGTYWNRATASSSARVGRRDRDLAGHYPDTALAVTLDVTNPERRATIVNEADARFSAIDVLVNDAAIDFLGGSRRKAGGLPRALQGDFFGAVALLRLVLPGMRSRRRGTIVDVSSMDRIGEPAGERLLLVEQVRARGADRGSLARDGALGLRAFLVEPGSFRARHRAAPPPGSRTRQLKAVRRPSGAFATVMKSMARDLFYRGSGWRAGHGPCTTSSRLGTPSFTQVVLADDAQRGRWTRSWSRCCAPSSEPARDRVRRRLYRQQESGSLLLQASLLASRARLTRATPATVQSPKSQGPAPRTSSSSTVEDGAFFASRHAALAPASDSRPWPGGVATVDKARPATGHGAGTDNIVWPNVPSVVGFRSMSHMCSSLFLPIEQRRADVAIVNLGGTHNGSETEPGIRRHPEEQDDACAPASGSSTLSSPSRRSRGSLPPPLSSACRRTALGSALRQPGSTPRCAPYLRRTTPSMSLTEPRPEPITRVDPRCRSGSGRDGPASTRSPTCPRAPFASTAWLGAGIACSPRSSSSCLHPSPGSEAPHRHRGRLVDVVSAGLDTRRRTRDQVPRYMVSSTTRPRHPVRDPSAPPEAVPRPAPARRDQQTS